MQQLSDAEVAAPLAHWGLEHVVDELQANVLAEGAGRVVDVLRGSVGRHFEV